MSKVAVMVAIAELFGVAAIVAAFVIVGPHLPGRYFTGLVVVVVAVAMAIVLGVSALWWSWRALIVPLHKAAAAIRGLTGGEEALRVPVAGPAELRELAEAVNAQSEAVQRVRDAEAERERLLRVARQTVQRIREHLRVEDVMREARQAIQRELDADEVYVHVIREGEIGPPEGAQVGWAVKPGFIENMPPEAYQLVEELLTRRQSLVIQDVQGPESDWLPAGLREPLRAAGIVSELLTPFGESTQFYGIIVATRMSRGHPWTPPEVEAVEWVAGDLGQALRQARVYEQENRLVAELQALDRVKSDFLATVSHELRTPLTSIAGFVELLADEEAGPLTPAQRRMMETLGRNTARLRHLIEDLLTLSKIESGTFKTAMQPVNLPDIVAAAATTFQLQAQDRNIRLAVTSGPATVLVNGDAGQLERMVGNVLSNAVKFTQPGGRVDVGVSAHGHRAVVQVTDTGIGIPQAEQKGLSSRFFRASNATELSIPGTGLGLTIVRSIVANHSGQLELRSQEGEGTTVTIQIPLLTGEGDAAGRAGSGGDAIPAAAPGDHAGLRQAERN